MEMIRLVLEEKTGVEGSNPHYDLAPPSATTAAAGGGGRAAPAEGEEEEETMSMAQATRTSSAQTPTTAPGANETNGVAGEDEGMYL
jgi:hypothetical protein